MKKVTSEDEAAFGPRPRMVAAAHPLLMPWLERFDIESQRQAWRRIQNRQGTGISRTRNEHKLVVRHVQSCMRSHFDVIFTAKVVAFHGTGCMSNEVDLRGRTLVKT